MKILVIGGSYFLGRVFVMSAMQQHDITVVNRGSQSMAGLNCEFVSGDRHDTELWKNRKENYDVIVDFCAYTKGDIQTVLDNISGKVKQYIFISSVDVYSHGCLHEESYDKQWDVKGSLVSRDFLRDEQYPYENKKIAGDAGAYIEGKIALEQELLLYQNQGIYTTILRPSVIYGPLNYAPRELVFISEMAKNHRLFAVTDANGRFQMVYVKDVAEAIKKCIGSKDAFNESFNICGDEILDYSLLAEAFGYGAKDEVERIFLTVSEAEAIGLPLPFAVKEEENHLCSNEKSKTVLGISYLPFLDGMKKTCNAFWDFCKE